MATYFSITADVRKLARSVLSTDFADASIVKAQEMAASYIITKTKKSDWDSDDLEYPLVQQIESILAAIYVLRHYDTTSYATILEGWMTEVNEGITAIIENSDEVDVDEPTLEISRTEFKTYPKNPDATISRGRLALATDEVYSDPYP